MRMMIVVVVAAVVVIVVEELVVAIAANMTHVLPFFFSVVSTQNKDPKWETKNTGQDSFTNG